MKKKICLFCCFIGMFVFVIFGIYICRQQYNSHNIGRYLCIEIDNSGWKNVGISDGMNVRTYNLKNAYFVSLFANKIQLDEAIRTNKVNIKDMCKYPFDVKKITTDDQVITTYIFENYQIIVTNEECIISPINAIQEFSHIDAANIEKKGQINDIICDTHM